VGVVGATSGTKHESLLDNLESTILKPLVWAPVFGASLVLFGVKLPPFAEASVRLIGATAGGTPLVALGVRPGGLTPRRRENLGVT
jgi:predicted permease